MSVSRDDSGMTLVELLISIAILGLIIGPLVIAMYMSLSTAKAATGRTTDSTGAQLLSAYFASDVEGADVVRKTGFTCGAGQTGNRQGRRAGVLGGVDDRVARSQGDGANGFRGSGGGR